MTVFEKSYGAIVYYVEDGNYLFLLLKHRGRTGRIFWKPPKGQKEEGESEEQAALREIKEETGLECELIPGFRESTHFFYKSEKDLVSKEVVYFLAKAKSKEVKVSFEHEDAKWFNPEEALNVTTFENDKLVLKKAIEFLKTKVESQ
ncbi:MAG: NUDIX domain-containing protein [archaeon]